MIYAYPLGSSRVGVRCSRARRSPKKYVIDPEKGETLVLVKKGALITPLECDEMVVTEEGEKVRPAGRFFRTAETIDPYHIILDMF